MNSTLVQNLLLHLARLGVQEVCVAAGARNTPLITALLACPGLKVWHFFEERCAGFFALGRIMMKRRPVAVVTTSGTAAAELLPAMIEAYYQALPLIAITADRPSSYRGSGAPQAIEQVGLFGVYAGRTLDMEAGREVVWPTALIGKPLHVNICFDEPLVDDIQGIDFSAWAGESDSPAVATHEMREVLERFLAKREELVVIAGGLHPEEAAMLQPALIKLGVPIIAEATANLTDPALQALLVRGGEKALKALNPQRLLRLGCVPSWRWWRDLEDRRGVHVMHLSNASFPGLASYQGVAVQPLALLAETLISAPSKEGIIADYRVEVASKLNMLVESHPLSEVAWMQHLGEVIPPGAPLFLGNSLPIREWNLAGRTSGACFANRGANGIDGLVSTFYGLSEGAAESWMIVGDLSALYDLAAPWIAEQLSPGNRRIVIINNGGGKIFSRVESLRKLDDAARTLIENRHAIDFRPWAELWGMNYQRVEKPEDLAGLPAGDVIVEVRPDAMQTDAFWEAWA